MILPLPINRELPRILRSLRDVPRLVLKAEPGAGKTTRVPPALLDPEVVAPPARVLVLEPRRIAAVSAARRVAAERGAPLGEEVGFRVRFHAAVSPGTRLEYLTEGVLLRRLQGDPALEGVGAVILDEFHERTLAADLALGLLREVQATVRPDLRLIVMSATLDPLPIARYLGGCPVLDSPGRAHPIEIEHRAAGPAATLEGGVADALARLLERGLDGSALVFLPGAAEIRRCLRALEPLAARHDLDVVPLHGDLPIERQEAAIRGGPRRRVVLSTNVAEASVTVDGVVAVIDGGRARVARYDAARGLDRLRTERISRSSAAQRAGRAGRMGPGLCFRLYSAAELAAMPADPEPEIHRVDLSESVLRLRAWGTRDLQRFEWLTPPRPESVRRAERLLVDLGALDDGTGAITRIGRSMLRYPAHPRHARVLAESASTGCYRAAAVAVALAAERDIRRAGRSLVEPGPQVRPEVRASSDLLVLADLYLDARRRRFSRAALSELDLDPRTVHRVDRTIEQLLRMEPAGGAGSPIEDSRHARSGVADSLGSAFGKEDEALLLRAILAGHPDRVVKRRRGGSREGLLVGGTGVELDPGSAVREAACFVALDAIELRGKGGRRVLVRTASAIRPEWLGELFPTLLDARDEVRFLEAEERITARRFTRFRDLVVEERETGEIDPDAGGEILHAAAAARLDRAVTWGRDLEDALARIETLRRLRPELGIPPARSGLFPRALGPFCRGKRSFAELRRLPAAELARALLASLPHPADRALEALVPARIRLPGGRNARIDYGSGEQPILAARLQELFGWTQTPAVGGGRLPLLLHLLGPNQRPLQVTTDLESFWRNVYPKQRIALRRRYPKHAWPEDPLTAVPESRPGGGRKRR